MLVADADVFTQLKLYFNHRNKKKHELPGFTNLTMGLFRNWPKNVGDVVACDFVYLAASTAQVLGEGPLFLKRRRENRKKHVDSSLN